MKKTDNPERIVLLTPKDIQEIFGIGKNQAYALMCSASFPSIRLNRRLFVEQSAFREWLTTYEGREYNF